MTFRKEVEGDIQRISESRLQQHADPSEQATGEWNQIAKRIRESPYTAFVNSQDPGADDKYLHEGWFKEALDQIKPFDNSHYFPYAPQKGKDELPPHLIHWGLLLGRFLYEHLFPVPPRDNSGPVFFGGRDGNGG